MEVHMPTPLRVLILEDQPADTELVLHELRQAGFDPEWQRVETEEEYLAALHPALDVILSDYSLPQFDGLSALRLLRARGLDVPFILISGTIGEEVAVSTMKEGADDYLLKDRLTRLGPAVKSALEQKQLREERKRDQEEISYQARLLRHINDAVIATDDQFRITAWNHAAEAIYGWTSAEVMGRNVAEILSSGFTDRQRAEAKELLQKSSIRSERIHSRKNGQPVYVEENTIALIDERSRISGYVSVNRDITERKQAEEAFRNAEARYRILFEQSPNGVLLVDLDTGKTIEANETAYKQLGYTREEFAALRISDYEVSEKPGEIARHMQKVIREGNDDFETLHRTKSGEIRNMRVLAKTIQLSGRSLFYAIFQDITARKQAEAKIQRQLQQLNSLRAIDVAISSSFDIRVTLDILLQQVVSQLDVDAAVILLFNPHTQTTEYAASRGFRSNALHQTQLKLSEGYEIRAVHERQTIHIPDLLEAGGEPALAMQIANEEFVDYYGIPLIVKGEVKGVLEIYHRSRLNPNAERLGYLETLAGQAAIAIDNARLFESLQRSNTELEQRVAKRTEELNQTNIELEYANRAKDEFLATMSHELRTPLNSILGLSESLLEQRRDPLSEHQQRSLQIIESSGRHLLELINDILDVSKIEAGKFDYYPQIIVVDELCRASLSFVKEQATRKSITVTYEEETPVNKVYADPRRLKQILVNLLTNAVKFTPENGQVILQVRADAEQDRIQFSVIDSGIGIALEDLKQLFIPFSQVDNSLTREYEGTGLGLALVQKLTDLHGGSVDVESEVGRGSRFTINLPLGKEIVAQQEIIASGRELSINEQAGKSNLPAEEQLERGVILLAEDHMANILTIGDYLESHGYQIVIAHDGLEAIEKAEEFHPNIILMDIQMPALDGLEAIRRLRALPRFASTPIVALTALAMPGDRERCIEAGASEYMSKPVGLKKLLHTINNLLGSGNK